MTPRLPRRWLPLAVLTLLAAALCGALVIDHRADEARRRADELAPSFRASAVTEVHISRDGRTLRLEKRGQVAAAAPEAGWWIDELGRANDRAVDAMLDAIDGARIQRRTDLAANMAGLAPARVTVEAGGVTIAVGQLDGTGQGAYVLRDGTVVVVDAGLREALDVPLDALRDRSAAALPLGAAASIALVGAKGTVRLSRNEGGWRLVEPFAARADQRRVAELVGALSELDAQRFAADVTPAATPGPGPGPWAGTSPSLTVLIDGRERARIAGDCPAQVVAAGAAAPSGEESLLDLRWDGAALCFPRSGLAALLLPVDQLRDPRPWPFEAAAVRSVVLGGGALTLERAGVEWRMSAPAQHMDRSPADDEAVRDLLDGLSSTEGHPATAAFTPSGAARVVGVSDTGERVTLWLGRAGDPPAVRRDDEPGAIAVPTSFLAMVSPDPLRFRPRRVAPLRESEVRRLRVDGVLTIERAAAGWQITAARSPSPPGSRARLDGEAVARLVAAVASLRAAGWSAPSTADGLERPARRLRVELDGAQPPVELAISKPDAAGCRARLAGDPATMRLPADTCADLLVALDR